MEIGDDTERLNTELRSFNNIPGITDVSAQQEMDRYFRVKTGIQTLIEQQVFRLKNAKEEIDEL